MDILENTEKYLIEYAKKGYGQTKDSITEEEIIALKEGKCLGFSDGEYTHILIYKN